MLFWGQARAQSAETRASGWDAHCDGGGQRSTLDERLVVHLLAQVVGADALEDALDPALPACNQRRGSARRPNWPDASRQERGSGGERARAHLHLRHGQLSRPVQRALLRRQYRHALAERLSVVLIGSATRVGTYEPARCLASALVEPAMLVRGEVEADGGPAAGGPGYDAG